MSQVSASVPGSVVWQHAKAGASALGLGAAPGRLMGGIMAVADISLIAGASFVAHALRHGLEGMRFEEAASTCLAGVLMLNAMTLGGAYAVPSAKKWRKWAGRSMQAWTMVFALLLLMGYITKTSETYSRVWAVVWYVSVLTGLPTLRCLQALWLRRWHIQGRLTQTVAIVDTCGHGADMARRLRQQHIDDVRLVGLFPSDSDGLGRLLALSKLFRIDEILVSVTPETSPDVTDTLRRLGTIPADVSLCPVLPDVEMVPVRDARLTHGIASLSVHRRPMSGWGGVIKRMEDLVLGACVLVLASPVLVAAALCIRLETPGPVFFRQERKGFNDNIFTVWKFRTMYHGLPPDGTVQARKGDPRVTRVGRILRRTSIDELPQIFNVLRGDMSLVGPRPHAVAHDDHYSVLLDDYIGRHRVKPGITGWAQVNGLRGETETLEKMRARVEYDLAYIDGWSILLDLKILMMTAVVSVFDKNAY